MAAAFCGPDANKNLKFEDCSISEPTKAKGPKSVHVEGEVTNGKTELNYGWRYWAVITALSVTALLPAMEGTVVSTALPSIIQDLHGGELYVWVVNSYFLTRYMSRSLSFFAMKVLVSQADSND